MLRADPAITDCYKSFIRATRGRPAKAVMGRYGKVRRACRSARLARACPRPNGAPGQSRIRLLDPAATRDAVATLIKEARLSNVRLLAMLLGGVLLSLPLAGMSEDRWDRDWKGRYGDHDSKWDRDDRDSNWRDDDRKRHHGKHHHHKKDHHPKHAKHDHKHHHGHGKGHWKHDHARWNDHRRDWNHDRADWRDNRRDWNNDNRRDWTTTRRIEPPRDYRNARWDRNDGPHKVERRSATSTAAKRKAGS